MAQHKRTGTFAKRMKAEGVDDTKQMQLLELYVQDTRLMVGFIQQFIGNMSNQVDDLSESTQELGQMLGTGEAKAQLEEDNAAAAERARNRPPKKAGWAKREDTPTDGEQNEVVKDVLLGFADVMTSLAQV